MGYRRGAVGALTTGGALLTVVSCSEVLLILPPQDPAGDRDTGMEALREHWRQVVLDVATPDEGDAIDSDATADKVGAC